MDNYKSTLSFASMTTSEQIVTMIGNDNTANCCFMLWFVCLAGTLSTADEAMLN